MRAITRARFEGLAAYTRRAAMAVMADELGWFSSEDESVIAALIRDTDGEYSAHLLMRDLDEKYRWIGSTGYHAAPEGAVIELRSRIARAAADPDEFRVQGDEAKRPVDFFTPLTDRERLHPHFVRLSEELGFVAARRLITSMMRWYDDVDGNFVEQFQTSGFDQRVWELYLFAALTEAGYDVERPKPAPDFLATGPRGRFALEAVTVNPSIGPGGKATPSPRLEPDHDPESYRRDYLPLKYAGPLTAKLKKKYWERPEVADVPLTVAIQDFHDTMSMTYTGSALSTYLYGIQHDTRTGADGGRETVATKVEFHMKGKTPIPSGFFFLPDAENVSAVIFNASATLSKFNRMGVVAGFGSDDVTLVVKGLMIDPDEDATAPLPFAEVVGPDYEERWLDGAIVFHNPRAVRPLDPASLPGTAQHFLQADGTMLTLAPAGQVIGSVTSVLAFGGSEED